MSASSSMITYVWARSVDVIEQANDTVYGLASAVFSKDINRAIRVAHALESGTAWVGHDLDQHPASVS